MSRRSPNSACAASNSARTPSAEPTSGESDDVLPTTEHFKQELERITGNAEIEEALTFCRDLFEREEQRAASLESKATTLMGFGALTAAFVSGFAGLLLDEATAPCMSVVKVLALVYILLVSSFASAIFCGLQALLPQMITVPAPGDILELAQSNVGLTVVRRERAGEFYKSYLANRETTNKKGSWVKLAQVSVVFGMVCLLLVAIVLSVHLILI
ncbi:MAG: hypothetical protein CEE40_11780 [Chloroflexi bacterium B3_Chlor]|nr:MAG: hypothetical protein CEE40_11780 [Chloroflexi bacterium B3_Chlor]